jgi:hypothetical protein
MPASWRTRLSYLRHVLRRSAELSRRFNVGREFARVGETCVPSYLHRNPLPAGAAWWRLFAAARLFRRSGARLQVLDFGTATGGHLEKPLAVPGLI